MAFSWVNELTDAAVDKGVTLCAWDVQMVLLVAVSTGYVILVLTAIQSTTVATCVVLKEAPCESASRTWLHEALPWLVF